MMPRLTFSIAIVDPSAEFGRRIETSLQSSIPDYAVIAYDSADQFLESLTRYPHRVPLVVVADSAARTPSVRAGVFCRAREKVPRCRGVLYSALPRPPEKDDMVDEGVLGGSVVRGSAGDMDRLTETVQKVLDDFFNSGEGKFIKGRQPQVASPTDLPGEAPREAKGTDTLLDRLTEIARGTERGHELLSLMLEAGAVPRDGGASGEERTDAGQTRGEFGHRALQSLCTALTILAVLCLALGIHTGMFWELVLPSSFGLFAFGAILLAILRLNRHSGI